MAICSQGWVLEKKMGLTVDLEAAQKGPKGGYCDTLNRAHSSLDQENSRPTSLSEPQFPQLYNGKNFKECVW